jgi:predicted sugar kinase
MIAAVERYFDFLQRAMEMNRSIAVQWTVAVSMLSGVARERAESAGEVVRARSESVGEVVREQAESFEPAVDEQAEKAEQELAREARRIEREKARQAHHPTCQVPLQY